MLQPGYFERFRFDFLVEARGLEPLTSCMPCKKIVTQNVQNQVDKLIKRACFPHFKSGSTPVGTPVD